MQVLHDAGCRKGRECRFLHEVTDDRRRCYVCGSTEHLSSSCPIKSQGDHSKAKSAKDSSESSSTPKPADPEGSEDTSAMRELL